MDGWRPSCTFIYFFLYIFIFIYTETTGAAHQRFIYMLISTAVLKQQWFLSSTPLRDDRISPLSDPMDIVKKKKKSLIKFTSFLDIKYIEEKIK